MISVEGLKVEFGVKPLFHDVSFVINDRDRIALVGKNGAGKSTMLKILCGLQKPTAGVVAIPNETTIGYLPQVMKLQDDTTVKEEIRKAFAHNTEMKARLDKMQQEMADRTDYESESYAQLVEKFTQEHERYMMMGGENYEAEIEYASPLSGLGLRAMILSAQPRSFPAVGECVSNLPRFCCRSLMSCSSMSLPTTLILKVSSGWSSFWRRVPRLWFW